MNLSFITIKPFIKGCFTKNQDFHFFDSVKFVLVIERIKGFDHHLVFLWVSKQKILIQKLFCQISRIQLIATQRFFQFGQKLSTSKVSKYDTSRVKRNIVCFEDILCTFYSVMVKEIKINDQIVILTFFH